MKKCSICGKEYQIKKLNFKGQEIVIEVAMCNCEEKLIQEEQRTLSRMKKISNSNIYSEYLKFATKKLDKELLPNSVNVYLKNIRNFFQKQIGLFLIGIPGIGKTVSLVYVMLELVKKFDASIFYIVEDELISLYKSFYPEEKRKYNQIKNYKVLFIDDVGIRKENLYDIIDYRVHNGLLTFLASNLKFDELEEILTEPVLSRIKSKMIIEVIEGREDLRRLNYAN